MPIRHYLLILIGVCTLAMVGLSTALHAWFKKIETRHHIVGASSLTLKEVTYLDGSLSRLLTTADLVIGSYETHLAGYGIQQCDQLQDQLFNLGSHPLLAQAKSEIAQSTRLIAAIRAQLQEIFRSGFAEEDGQQAALSALDGSSNELITRILFLGMHARSAAADALAQLDKERRQFHNATLWGLCITLFGAFLLSRWAWVRIASPLQELTVSARRSMAQNLQFEHCEKGPFEVRNLSRSISLFINLLEDNVAKRTRQLQLNTVKLESEIRERVTIEKELSKAKVEAEQASDAKSDFLANISHEMRTPLNSILGFGELLLDTPLNAEQSEFLSVVRSSSGALLNLINDFLDFSKIEAGKIDIEYRPFYLRDCIEASIDIASPAAAEKRLDLAIEIHPDTPTSIVGDESRLRQVLLNLVGNAVKFTHSGSVIVSVKPTGTSPDGSPVLEFRITDTGIGIAADKQHLLFQSFQQIQTSNNRSFGGTGLGLAISRRLVELMGGDVSVDSKPDVGSVFSFTLPVKFGGMAPRPFEKLVPEFKGKRLLLIDDRDARRKRLADQATLWGMETTESADSNELIESMRRGEPYEVILSSLDVPEVCSQAWRDEATKFSGQGSKFIGIRDLDQRGSDGDDSFTAFVTNPVKPAAIYQRMLEALGSSPRHSGTSGDLESTNRRNSKSLPRILVAEDIAMNRKLVSLMLSKLGYTADFVTNGREALECATNSPYDIILMDVQMPEMDGLEATRRLRETLKDSCPDIIALTANSMDRDQKRCLAAGMSGHLGKPLHIGCLSDILSKWKGRQKAAV